MRVLILDEHDVEDLLPMQECIGVMEEALTALARGEIHNPLRVPLRAPGAKGLLGLMPAFRGGEDPVWALKEVCVQPDNPSRGLDTHLGAVLLHDGVTGELRLIASAAAITAIRTAAVSAVATRLLAREDASTLAILGAGVQARSHLRAIPLVRAVGEIRICSRTAARARELAALDPRARAVDSVEDAVAGADIIVTATSSREPVLRREWIAGGAHINAVGSSVASARELDAATVAAASLFVDRRESTVNESGDYLAALREGAISEGHIRAELGEILLGSAQGRNSRDEITLFKSLGLAAEDLAAAAFLFRKGSGSGRGVWVEI
ncbi:MAG TPA: ornithine cyclodeaminase family protein [Thermoanaerobaculia bacterium]|nr:ornithine cyclodeaminase family protein [Thermoanaerobaculia bacterium]